VAVLPENRAYVAPNGHRGWTALRNVTVRGHETVMRLVQQKWVDVDKRDCFGETALHRAVKTRDEARVRQPLEKGANTATETLRLVVMNRDEAVVRLLLEKGADVDAKEWHEERALHLAIKSRDAAVVRLLVEKRARLETQGLTALHLASRPRRDASSGPSPSEATAPRLGLLDKCTNHRGSHH
jgi:ankyrin repeat protein